MPTIKHKCAVCSRVYLCPLCSNDSAQTCKQNIMYPRFNTRGKFICTKQCSNEFFALYVIHML